MCRFATQAIVDCHRIDVNKQLHQEVVLSCYMDIQSNNLLQIPTETHKIVATAGWKTEQFAFDLNIGTACAC